MYLRRLLFVLVFMLGLWYWLPVRAGVVRGESMYPTLKNGQLFLLDRGFYRDHAISRGDIIALSHDGQVYIKRVYALAGDVIWELAYPDTPNVIIEGRVLPRLRRAIRERPGIGTLVQVKVPPHGVFVLGDEQSVSYDSREFGPVSDSCVLGRVRI